MIETTLDEANKLLSFIKQKIELNKPLIEDSSPDNYTPVIDTLAISVPIKFSWTSSTESQTFVSDPEQSTTITNSVGKYNDIQFYH